MNKFPLLNQIFFFKNNRLYQLILKKNRVYGVYLDGQFHQYNWLRFIASLVSLILAWILNFIFLNILPPAYIRALVITGFNLLFLLILWWCIDYLIMSLPYFRNKLEKIYLNKNQSRINKTQEHIKLIDSNKNQEFLELNSKNFILDISEINKIEYNSRQFWLMWPETHFGQLKLRYKMVLRNILFCQRTNFQSFRNFVKK